MARIVLAGYLVRNPLGGYAWQAAHYLLGLCALGHDAWFYEDTGHFALAYNPLTNDYGPRYEHGIAATADFLGRIGLGERWVFVDAERGAEPGRRAATCGTRRARPSRSSGGRTPDRPVPPTRRSASGMRAAATSGSGARRSPGASGRSGSAASIFRGARASRSRSPWTWTASPATARCSPRTAGRSPTRSPSRPIPGATATTSAARGASSPSPRT